MHQLECSAREKRVLGSKRHSTSPNPAFLHTPTHPLLSVSLLLLLPPPPFSTTPSPPHPSVHNMDSSSTLSGWYEMKKPKLFDEIQTGGGCNQWWLSFDSNDKPDDGFTHSHSTPWSCPSLMQNCDLPPPVKVFTRSHKDDGVLSSIIPKHTSRTNQEEENGEVAINKNDKVELMKALQLSQSRARRAEEEASVMAEEKDQLSAMLLKESFRLFAHRQWVKLLQFEVSQLKQKKQQSPSKAEDAENAASFSWYVTLALCLGIAGVGIAAVGCRYSF